MKMGRKYWVGGNWKCNGSVSSVKELCENLNKYNFSPSILDVVVCPSPVHLSLVKEKVAERYQVAAQNCSKTGNGAFTGEVSGSMLDDMGVPWTLIGHSERRQFYGETDQVIADKVEFILKNSKLNLSICVGELLEEREAGKTEEVCTRQVTAFMGKIKDWSRVVIAYEPVWAIGTGKVATPEQAQESHESIRNIIKKEKGAEVANALRIVYGGSVTDSNCASLIDQSDIDGFLVGGASLKPGFETIITTVEKKA